MTDWLYYRVYVPELGEIRDLLERVVAPAIRRFTAVEPGLRWFFLQYVDVVGLQLRLRLSAPAAVLATFEAVLDAELAAALDDPATVGGPSRTEPANRMVVKRLYEPEYAKFGGVEGVALAERLMQLGSETALAFARPSNRSQRSAIGAAHTFLMAEALPAAERTAFLHQYAWYWSGRGHRDGQLEPADPAAARRAKLLRAQIDAVLAEPADRAVLTGYVDRFWAQVRAGRPDRPTQLIAAHHIHLMNNRLGLVPSQEMQIARLLWLHRLHPTAGRRRRRSPAKAVEVTT